MEVQSRNGSDLYTIQPGQIIKNIPRTQEKNAIGNDPESRVFIPDSFLCSVSKIKLRPTLEPSRSRNNKGRKGSGDPERFHCCCLTVGTGGHLEKDERGHSAAGAGDTEWSRP